MSENLTVWRPSGNQEGEYTQQSVLDIMDPADNTILLVDPSAVNIVDTGLLLTNTVTTAWTANDGA